jgi:hypothetical protein
MGKPLISTTNLHKTITLVRILGTPTTKIGITLTQIILITSLQSVKWTWWTTAMEGRTGTGTMANIITNTTTIIIKTITITIITTMDRVTVDSMGISTVLKIIMSITNNKNHRVRQIQFLFLTKLQKLP